MQSQSGWIEVEGVKNMMSDTKEVNARWSCSVVRTNIKTKRGCGQRPIVKTRHQIYGASNVKNREEIGDINIGERGGQCSEREQHRESKIARELLRVQGNDAEE